MERASVYEAWQTSSNSIESKALAFSSLLPDKYYLVEKSHFPACLPEMITIGVWWTWFGAIKEIRVVAALSQLHECVQEGLGLARLSLRHVQNRLGVSIQNVPVVSASQKRGAGCIRKRSCHQGIRWKP